jgi:hypothetical protein
MTALALLVVGLLCVWSAGCGGGSVSDAASRAELGRHLEGDRDDDDMTGGGDPDDSHLRSFGGVANMADRQAITKLVRRYYVAAATADGATACALMLQSVASEANLGESAEAIYPPAPNAPLLGGDSCAQVMSIMFKAGHHQIAPSAATLVVTGIRVSGSRAIVFLGFALTPERQLRLGHEHGEWKVDGLLDSYIP